ncbi:hypothetical protein CMUS01_08906 [Colletotrichum musicola]|uniref:Uncharacterized protein n=1 Tax=Colletotrichum musicola TaxID=2175873 RepID=A0A8H6NCD9_9PEZI|nr:hypothetical protein CMUS01_08906 [Colletotrichum musicola]
MPPSKALDLPFGKPIRKRSQSSAARLGAPPPSHGEPCGSPGTDVPGQSGKTDSGRLRTATGDWERVPALSHSARSPITEDEGERSWLASHEADDEWK